MTDGLRVWGWKELDWKRKEMLTVRRVAMCKNALQQWEKPERVSCKEVMDVCEPALVVARAVLLGMGMADADVTRILDQDKAPRQGSEQATSFFEMFKYQHFDFSETGEAAVPAEEHKDVGIVTISSRGSDRTGPAGVRLARIAVGVPRVAGNVARAAQLLCCAVRVVLAEPVERRGAGDTPPRRAPQQHHLPPPRYSSIFEVLPNPDTYLSGLGKTGKKLFAASADFE
ncbi:Oxidoreductase [Diplonema papillatum]|nr:Oxidoreductase [Diplonema papillatum]